MPQDGELLRGQQYDPSDGFTVPFTEQMMHQSHAEPLVGQAKTEIIPVDANANRVRVYGDPADVSTYYLAFPGTASVQLPDVLEEVLVTYNATRANGLAVSDGDGFSAGTGPNLSLSLSNRAQSSVNIVPDLQPRIKQYWGANVPTQNYLFYIAGNATIVQVLTRLTTIAGASVLAWPAFRPQSHTITLKGQSASVSANVGIQQHVALGTTTSYTKGSDSGYSYENGVTIRTYQIPPTLHGAITISTPTQSDIATASASTSWPGGTNWPAMSKSLSAQTQVITASVTPTTLPATSPTGIPNSGLYLLQANADPYKHGLTRVYATVIDFSFFA